MSEPVDLIDKRLFLQLRELKKLLDEGLLTKEEFDAQKEKLLHGGSNAPDLTNAQKLPAGNRRFEETDTDAAERQRIEKSLSGGGMGCLEIEPLVVNTILAFFLPFLWIPVIAFVVARIITHSKRNEARVALKANSLSIARAALDSAKTWNGIAMVASVILWGTEFIGLLLLLTGVSSLT